MRKGVEGKSPRCPSSGISEAVSGKGMSEFVDGDSDYEIDDIEKENEK